MHRVEKLIKQIKKYNPQADVKLIKRAYQVARDCHVDQFRKSGDEFIEHPLGVAQILADLELDTITIIAALLHDAVEDTSLTLERIRGEFGDEICNLIDGVTKLSKIKFKSHEEQQAENLRKMLIAMAKDIRVILIKLADRLHNMRTISHLPREKQRRIASETLEIYAPIVHRLGISQVKWELEDLAFSVLEPRKYAQIEKMVAESREERGVYVNAVIKALAKELNSVEIKCEISGRSKHFYSIYQKMVQKGREFSEIYDLTAIRVIVDSIRDCYGALGTIHSVWKPVPGRFKDYIAMPKFNMYQSLHTTVIGPMGRPLEIQIRTKQMHKTAEYGIAAHWRYKEGVKESDEFDERLAWLRQILEWQSELKDPREFMETLKIDLFEDEVFVFTPKGDVVSLPSGSTPIDFAYTIHTDVGHSCIGAKVNNQIVPLNYKLQMGDIVEILTSKTASGPSKDWLQIVKTSRAKSKIKQWFSKLGREDSEHLGKEALQKILRKSGLGLHSATSDILESVAKEFNFHKIEDLYASVGMGKTSAKQVATRLITTLKEEKPAEEEKILVAPPRKGRTRPITGVKIKGLEDALVRLARCCNPVPKDEIIGFVTQGRGVSVHRRDCPNAKQLLSSPHRLIEVYWDVRGPAAFQVEIQVEAIDRMKLLRDISSVISDAGVNILSANVTTTRDGFAIFRFSFEIENLERLENILSSIGKIDVVFDAHRV
ncbi:MAG: bifunctional (p)ppGpp synthetase/guanosine-3',5'-bis(diphosphate) 3'-pyrophosphohydrolase [Actinomycetota bacterium]|nr:bifunctional (p)ppGpp synthetase/guanosine-3',5'-bis(diphosphate) 3'-pyrophosphohydrolase [Actinomycetota bacterium]